MDIPNHYSNVVLHEYVIMPNHVHCIVQIVDGCDGWDCRGETYFAHKMVIPHHYPNVVLHEYAIMPNHVHCIVQICGWL